MSRQIWKFPIDLARTVEIEMPYGAEPLSVQLQNGEICLWALVDTSERKVMREVCIVGTGHPYDPCEVGRYVGTVVTQGGALVWHVFIADSKEPHP